MEIFRRLVTSKSGNIAVIFALALPAMLILISGTVDYVDWLLMRAQMQAAADGGALAGAKELRLANANPAIVVETARSQALLNLGGRAAGATIQAAVQNAKTEVQVEIDATPSSLFGSVAPVQFAHIHVEAVGRTSASSPTCLLSLDQSALIGVGVSASTINSPGCRTYSDSKSPTGVTVLEGTINASQTCSSGGYVGLSISVSPPALTDCPVIGDPLLSRAPPVVKDCDHYGTIVANGTQTLYPGTYCGGLTVTLGATAILTKGVYVIKDGPLLVNLGATLNGTEVGFYLAGAAALLDFDFLSSINLKCPSDGPMAGMLFFEDRASPVGRIHLLSSRKAPELLGTLYFPNGNLVVGAPSVAGSIMAVCQNLPVNIGQCPPLLADIAIDSAWTIVIAHQIVVNFGVRLTLNTNYYGSPIMPPGEMGYAGARLSQ